MFDGSVWRRQWMPPSPDWHSLGIPTGNPQPNQTLPSAMASWPTILPPIVIPNLDGRVEIFVAGLDGALWHAWQTQPEQRQNGPWSGWASLGVPPGQPGVSARSAVGVNGGIIQFPFNPGLFPGALEVFLGCRRRAVARLAADAWRRLGLEPGYYIGHL